jgi:hypothetical protein
VRDRSKVSSRPGADRLLQGRRRPESGQVATASKALCVPVSVASLLGCVMLIGVRLLGRPRSHRCTEHDVEALREAGWSDEEIMDIAEVTAMLDFANRLASGLGWRPNQ